MWRRVEKFSQTVKTSAGEPDDEEGEERETDGAGLGGADAQPSVPSISAHLL